MHTLSKFFSSFLNSTYYEMFAISSYKMRRSSNKMLLVFYIQMYLGQHLLYS